MKATRRRDRGSSTAMLPDGGGPQRDWGQSRPPPANRHNNRHSNHQSGAARVLAADGGIG